MVQHVPDRAWLSQQDADRLRDGIAPHSFTNPNGYFSPACTAMVERDGAGEDCGLPATDPIHFNLAQFAATEETMSQDTPAPIRQQVLQQAVPTIVTDRAATYGDASASFARIGRLWAAILDLPAIDPQQVALCMVALKISRATTSPAHADSYVDMAGYAALAAELGGVQEVG